MFAHTLRIFSEISDTKGFEIIKSFASFVCSEWSKQLFESGRVRERKIHREHPRGLPAPLHSERADPREGIHGSNSNERVIGLAEQKFLPIAQKEKQFKKRVPESISVSFAFQKFLIRWALAKKEKKFNVSYV